MIVTANDVAQRRQPLLYSLDFDLIRYRISEMLQFLVGGRGRHEEAFSVAMKWRFPSSQESRPAMEGGLYKVIHTQLLISPQSSCLLLWHDTVV